MLKDLLARPPARSVQDVIALMTAIDELLPDTDGLKWFNRLYLRVTAAVRGAIGTTSFRDPAFIAELDVSFANLYFSAVAAGADDPAQAPAAWRPLLRCRHQAGIARIQFALAGMNAHINRDLAQGIVDAFRTMGGDPLTDQDRHLDFDRVNPLLQQVEDQVKPEFSVGLIGAVDAIGGRVDDVVAMWNVAAAREAAWTNAQVLWALKGVPPLRDNFFRKLDSLTGLAGQGLLLPVGAVLRA